MVTLTQKHTRLIWFYTAWLCLISTGSLFAQQLVITSGTSIPLGYYSSTDVNSNKSGFARNGFCVNLAYHSSNNSVVGFSTQGYYNQNDIDLTGIMNHDLYPYSFTMNQLTPWRQFGLFGGIHIKNVDEMYSFNYHLMLGFVHSRTASYQAFNDTIFFNRISNYSNCVSLINGVGFSINLNKKVSLHANADYIIATPNYGFISIQDKSGNIYPLKIKNESDLNILQCTFGIGFKL